MTIPIRCTIKMEDHGCIEDTPNDPDGQWIFDPSHFINVKDYEFDFEVDATPDTSCGRIGRKHKMKRKHHSKSKCIYPGCDGFC